MGIQIAAGLNDVDDFQKIVEIAKEDQIVAMRHIADIGPEIGAGATQCTGKAGQLLAMFAQPLAKIQGNSGMATLARYMFGNIGLFHPTLPTVDKASHEAAFI